MVETWVMFGSSVANGGEGVVQVFIEAASRLSKTIETFLQCPTRRGVSIRNAFGYTHVNALMVVKFPVKESRFYVEGSTHKPTLNKAIYNEADSGAVGDRCKRFLVINAKLLGAAFSGDTRL